MTQEISHNSITNVRIIFLAEDDIDDQEFLTEAFRSIDPEIKLISFSSGLKFIKYLASTNADALPSLIILDYNIPEINGGEILKQLGDNERYAEIPKIVWSTSDSQRYRENCLLLGARVYMVKPSSINGIHVLAKQIVNFL